MDSVKVEPIKNSDIEKGKADKFVKFIECPVRINVACEFEDEIKNGYRPILIEARKKVPRRRKCSRLVEGRTKYEHIAVWYGVIGAILSQLAILDAYMLILKGVPMFDFISYDREKDSFYSRVDYNPSSWTWQGFFEWMFKSRIPPVLILITHLTFYYSIVLVDGVIKRNANALRKYFNYGCVASIISLGHSFLCDVSFVEYGFRYIRPDYGISFGIFHMIFGGGMLITQNVQLRYQHFESINRKLKQVKTVSL